MTKTMTMSFLAATLLIGLGGRAFATTSYEHQARQGEYRASRIDADPADPPIQARLDRSINGDYLGPPCCFGGEGYGNESYRHETRRAERESRAAY